MEFPADRLYSEHHLWVKQEQDHLVIGMTAFAVEELGAVDYVEFLEPLQTVTKDEPFGAVETSKAVTDMVSPLSGMVEAINGLLEESPNLLSDDPYESGWLLRVKLSLPEELPQLFNSEYYESLVGSCRQI